jgi:hypothetical protein
MVTPSLKEIEAQTWKYVDTLKDSPQARLMSREVFYEKYGGGTPAHKFGYGESELAFLRWEERGVLEPPGADPPGSPWWSEVNLWFIYLSELGARAREAGLPKEELPMPAQFWVDFIDRPGSQSWYKAHNSSIIDGYLKFPELAVKEDLPEQVFINMVLYRLLFAQSMVEGGFFFPRLGEILADPEGGAVDLITHLDDFYPRNYPMTPEEVKAVMGKAENLEELGVKFMDDVLIMPELTNLYRHAATLNAQPGLMKFIARNKPAYPDGKPKTPGREGCLFRVLGWLEKAFR